MTILKRTLSSGTTLALLILIVMYVVYMYSSIDVLTAENATDLLNNAAPLVIAATGLTLVIVVGGFDLSLGGVVTLANVILATQAGDDDRQRASSASSWPCSPGCWSAR